MGVSNLVYAVEQQDFYGIWFYNGIEDGISEKYYNTYFEINKDAINVFVVNYYSYIISRYKYRIVKWKKNDANEYNIYTLSENNSEKFFRIYIKNDEYDVYIDNGYTERSGMKKSSVAEINKAFKDIKERIASAPKKATDAEARKGSFTDSRDGKNYKTTKIGTQTWMAENLNYEAKGSKCHENKPDNCQKYGRLYDLNTATKACPKDWHLPSDKEWQTLLALGGIAKKEFKARSGWGNSLNGKSGNGTDIYGFSALPSDGKAGFWWATSGIGLIMSEGIYEPTLLSVRCLQDDMEAKEVAQIAKAKANDSILAYSRINNAYKTISIVGARMLPAEIKVSKMAFDFRDGKTYKILKIGTQTWMSENLNYEAKDSKCYDNKESNCQKYGRLYNWAMSKTACPGGWHLPTETEWTQLTKSAVSDVFFNPLGGLGIFARGRYNFRAAGYRGNWWSATENAKNAYIWNKNINEASLYKASRDKSHLFSIRCLKD